MLQHAHAPLQWTALPLNVPDEKQLANTTVTDNKLILPLLKAGLINLMTILKWVLRKVVTRGRRKKKLL
jgi:hypothetical protein